MESKADLGRIIEQCLKGKSSAQEELYALFYGYGLTVCLHYCQNRVEAEDVLIEGFCKVFENMKAFDASKDFKPWFRRVMVNTAIDFHRKYHKLPTNNSPLIVNEKEYSLTGLDQLQYDDLLKILQELPNQYRLVFNLYEIEGFTHQEIANKMEIGISTSKSNLSRAKQKLRKMVQFYGVSEKRKEI